MRLKLIGCSVVLRELSDAVARSAHLVDVQYLPAGLHDTGAVTMRSRIQEAIDQDAGNHDYILIGYGLCGNGTVGLQARSIPLVIPRAHDCITLLTGGRNAFREYFDANPGTYFRSSGWIERSEQLQSQVSSVGVNTPLESLIARYGQDSGRYLYEQFNRYRDSYSRLTFIRTGLEPDSSFAVRARTEARDKGWEYEELQGSVNLFRRLLSADWGDDFLIVHPGFRVVATYKEDILAAVPSEGGHSQREEVSNHE